MAKTQQLTSDDQHRALELSRDAPPTHFSFTVQSFSLLSKASIESYETNTFQAGGYKWKLCFYPSGNKSRNIKDYISLYLVMADTDSLNPGWDVSVVFRIFVFDQIQDKYLTVEDGTVTTRRFHARKMEWGFDQFMALKTFNDASNGYLVDDVAMFGAEVFVCKESSRGKEERLSMIKGAVATKHFWRIENFLKIDDEFLESEPFIAGDHTWKVQFYPKGKGEGKANHVSLYLVLVDDPSAPLPTTRTVYADFILRIKHQSDGRYIQNKANGWFSASKSKGWARFVQLNYLIQQGFLLRDTCNVEAEVTVLGVSD